MGLADADHPPGFDVVGPLAVAEARRHTSVLNAHQFVNARRRAEMPLGDSRRPTA